MTAFAVRQSAPFPFFLTLKPKNYTETEKHLCSFDRGGLQISVKQDHKVDSNETAGNYGKLSYKDERNHFQFSVSGGFISAITTVIHNKWICGPRDD